MHAAESRNLIAAVRASGLGAEQNDLIAALEARVRAQELQTARNRASQPSLVGGNPEGWMIQLQDFMENSARGTTVMWQPAGGGGPGTSDALISGSGHRYGGFLPKVPGPGYALQARRENDLEMIITIPTTCWEPQGGVEHPRMVSCTFRGYHKTHYLYVDEPGGHLVGGAMPAGRVVLPQLDSNDEAAPYRRGELHTYDAADEQLARIAGDEAGSKVSKIVVERADGSTYSACVPRDPSVDLIVVANGTTGTAVGFLRDPPGRVRRRAAQLYTAQQERSTMS